MSDANENDWNDTGRPSAAPGMTKGVSLQSGLSSHSQITDSNKSIGQGHGQGQRPSGFPKGKTATHGGKSFSFM